MPRPEKEPKTDLAKRLREIRRATGNLSRDDFADALGISRNTLAFYERGDNEPAATTLLAYVRLYNVSSRWLLLGEGGMFDKGGKKDLPLDQKNIDAAHLENAVRIVEKALADTALAADKKAELIKLVSAQLKAGKETGPISRIIDLLRP